MHPSGLAWQAARHGSKQTPAASASHTQGVSRLPQEACAMMSLPPDEAVVAALILVGLFMAAWWYVEYMR